MASFYSLYADDECQELVVYTGKPQGDCAQQQPPAYALASDYPLELCAASQPLRVYKTGAQVTISDSLYQKSSDGCGISGADPNSLVFFSTSEVPAQDLAEMVRVTE